MMTVRDELNREYFEWIYSLVSNPNQLESFSYRYLLQHLHDIEFTYSIRMDENRAHDGVDLRRRFALNTGRLNEIDILDGPCSVLEMMVALAIRCEESIMDDPLVGDRTKQWFTGMIVNLGLGSMMNVHYDSYFVETTIQRFLNRDYEPDGRGGLFRLRHPKCDLRNVEIWYQMCWYLDELFG